MNEVKDMFKPQKDIFENLKSYINENATLKTWVGKNKISNSNPMVVFKEARNELNTRSTTYDNTTRIMNYNINIYCNKRNDSREVVEELVVLVNEVMVGFYKMQGGLIAINDNYAAGRDVSWLWDVNFEILKNVKKEKLHYQQ